MQWKTRQSLAEAGSEEEKQLANMPTLLGWFTAVSAV